MKKLISLLLIILLLIPLFFVYFEKEVSATYSSKFANYPGYKELIDALQKEHPNWEFEIYETGLKWSDVIKEESTHYRNVTHILGGGWSCATCGNKTHEDRWYCASTATIAYYMDPRNSLNENYILQFEKLSYNGDLQTQTGVEQILKGCNYAQGKITYYDTKGVKKTINKTYSQVIMEAAKAYNISAYHLAARIRQEMGTGSGSVIISGKYKGYEGYYNYYNWGAYGSDIIGSGLKTAKENGWSDPEKAIKGGAKLIANDYIKVGQDTLYFQKFNVSNKNSLYTHQYMTNVSASKSEGATVKKTYTDIGLFNEKLVFKIPVYKDMPTYNCPEPGKETVVTQDVQTNGEVNVRKGKGTNSAIITTLKKGVKLIRIEYAQKKEGGYYWDKVVLSNGTKGYAIRDRLTGISLQSNCNEKDIVLNSAEVRNGPGKTGTEIISYIAPGQLVTVVEKNKYPNLDSENWYRIRLSDNTYGYVSIGSSNNPNLEKYDEDSNVYDYVKVVCTDGLNIRRAPTTSENNIMATVTKGTQLFRAQKNASNAGGYIWDKVVTPNGAVGYCVRQDKSSGQLWIESLSKTKYEVDEKNANIVCVPNITGEHLKELSSNIVVKKGSNTIANSAKIGTGYTISVNGKTYTAIVKGDTNGDGEVKATDYMKIKNYIMGTSKLTDVEKIAADVNNDNNIKATDYMKIKNYIMGTSTIDIN
ncbi:MAG: SH3 domain-containing protein [Clostridia bacterium]|nr:SH3 domain-containing protein [Clostridia bacterium]